ncbi:MAG TPA: hypothetical protein VHB48_06285 [Chitinophagaceae bacterium]|nr:hypothetical protein [Chitinophagaceae bacterium]
MTDRERYDLAMWPIEKGANRSSHDYKNKHGITSEIEIDFKKIPSIGLGIKLTGKNIHVEQRQQVFAVNPNELYSHFDELLRAMICTVSLEDLRPENF